MSSIPAPGQLGKSRGSQGLTEGHTGLSSSASPGCLAPWTPVHEGHMTSVCLSLSLAGGFAQCGPGCLGCPNKQSCTIGPAKTNCLWLESAGKCVSCPSECVWTFGCGIGVQVCLLYRCFDTSCVTVHTTTTLQHVQLRARDAVPYALPRTPLVNGTLIMTCHSPSRTHKPQGRNGDCVCLLSLADADGDTGPCTDCNARNPCPSGQACYSESAQYPTR